MIESNFSVVVYWTFSAKNTSIFTDDGWSHACFLFTMWPAALNVRSDGTDVAEIVKYFLAR